MSVFDDVLLAVIDMAAETEPYSNIVIGALPPDNGISLTWATGGVSETYWDKNMVYEKAAVLNGKHLNAQTVADALGKIHLALTRTKSYPATAQYQILDIASVATPAYLDREENGQVLWGSSLQVRFFVKGG